MSSAGCAVSVLSVGLTELEGMFSFEPCSLEGQRALRGPVEPSLLDQRAGGSSRAGRDALRAEG